MITLKLLAAVLLAVPVCLVEAPVAEADPLVPLTPAEINYLDNLHRVFVVSRVPEAFNSDGELLDKGRYVCRMRDTGVGVGYEATLVPPAVTQLAFIYLCPK